MSLFSVLLLHDFTLDSQYKCPEKRDEPAPRHVLGTYFIASGGVLMILYILCLKAMLSKELRKVASYKIMICLAIFDICSLFVNSLVTGFFGYQGLTYCDFPLFIFICGAHGFGCWLGCSMTCVTLALCRIADLNPKLKLDQFFQGSFMRLLIGYFFLVVGYGTWFTKPVIFRLEYMSWFFDPGVGHDTDLYTNLYHTINNIAMALLTSLLYSVLCYSVFKKNHHSQMSSQLLSTSQKQFCYQALVICVAHSLSSSVYVYMQFFYTPAWLIAAEQVGWQMCTGGICLVYLVFNKTIRTLVLKSLGLYEVLKNRVNNIVETSNTGNYHSATMF